MKVENYKGLNLKQVLGRTETHRDMEEQEDTIFTGNRIVGKVKENGEDITIILHNVNTDMWYNIQEDYYYESMENMKVENIKVGQVIKLVDNCYGEITIKQVIGATE